MALIYVETIAALEVPEGGSYDADTLAFGQKLVDECHKYGAKMVTRCPASHGRE